MVTLCDMVILSAYTICLWLVSKAIYVLHRFLKEETVEGMDATAACLVMSVILLMFMGNLVGDITVYSTVIKCLKTSNHSSSFEFEIIYVGGIVTLLSHTIGMGMILYLNWHYTLIQEELTCTEHQAPVNNKIKKDEAKQQINLTFSGSLLQPDPHAEELFKPTAPSGKQEEDEAKQSNGSFDGEV